MEQVWISIGSNVGDRLAQLRQAIAALAAVGRVFAVSDAYESDPVGYAAQPWFLNAVAGVEVESCESAEHVLHSLLSIEREMGRRRGEAGEIAKGPRVIDLDIILYGARVIDSASLRVPHPEMHRRRFVLEPLAQVAAQARHPVLRQSARQLLEALPADEHVVRRFAPLQP